MKLRLIRHGITEANEKKLYCGMTDLPLSLKGIEELQLLKKKSVLMPADIYITSDLKRAIQTLEILYEKAPDIIMTDFNEMDFGDFEMKSHNTLVKNNNYISWLNNIEEYYCPNGESRQTFHKRVKRGFNELLLKEYENIVVVAHGGVIVTIMEMLYPNQKTFYEWQPDNGLGYTLEFDRGNITKLTS